MIRAGLLALALTACGCPHPAPPMPPEHAAGSALLASGMVARMAARDAEQIGPCIGLRVWAEVGTALGRAVLAGRCAPPVAPSVEACLGMPGDPAVALAEVAVLVDDLAVLWEVRLDHDLLPAIRSSVTATVAAAASGDAAPVWGGTCP